jgi:transposase
LEKGRFRWPAAGEKQRSVTMRAEELAMLVNGLDLKQAQPRKWYRRSA